MVVPAEPESDAGRQLHGDGAAAVLDGECRAGFALADRPEAAEPAAGDIPGNPELRRVEGRVHRKTALAHVAADRDSPVGDTESMGLTIE